MFKKIFPLLFMIGFFIGCNNIVNVPMQYTQKEQQNLIARYIKYWNCRSNYNFKCSYQMELPYQRFIHDFHWYKIFHKNLMSKNFKIKLIKINKKGNIAIVKSQYVAKNTTYFFYDQWFKIDGIWFHKMKTSILPSLGGE